MSSSPSLLTPQLETLGKSGLAIPRFGLGTGPLGGLYEDIPEHIALATIEVAWDSGIRLFDTAAWYGRGNAEHRLGSVLRTKSRKDYVLTTKVGRTLHRPRHPAEFDRTPWKGGLRFDVKFDYSYEGIMRSYEQALQRLGIEAVDALAIHDLDRDFHNAEFEYHRRALLSTGTKALAELKASGDIKAIGMGFNLSPELDMFIDEIDLDYALVAQPYTLLDQKGLDTGMAKCLDRGVSVVIGAPFASGILATGSGAGATYSYGAAPDHIQDKVQRIEAICALHGVSLKAAAIQFPMAHPAVRAVIPGAVRAVQVRQNVAASAEHIPPAFWSDLKRAELIVAAAPTPD